ncbi:hypothetical protein EYF80_025947 [Liparis tanakae]|uniref:Uncharacterized protein n=1 Tax=Liparis tanakae TaxID=230148 RepID=A0A4Z2HDB2_9TELE|nr:hypothetical protein EYF80_025947 [Liparis tanakae]
MFLDTSPVDHWNSPEIIGWNGPPTGMRLHQSPSRPVVTATIVIPLLDQERENAIAVLLVGCSPLSEQDEVHLNMLEKHLHPVIRELRGSTSENLRVRGGIDVVKKFTSTEGHFPYESQPQQSVLKG